MVLHDTPWLLLVVKCCSLSLSVISFGASSIPPLQRISSCLPKDLGKACAHSFCVAFASRGCQAILPPTCGFMTSARIASSCVTRPRFELGHSSRAPQVSAKRVRLSCSLKSRFFSCMHHDVLNVGLFTPHMSSSPFAPVAIMPDVFDDSTAASEPGLNKASLSGSRLTFEWSHCSKIRYHGIQWQPQTSPALWCKAPLAPLGEHLSFN